MILLTGNPFPLILNPAPPNKHPEEFLISGKTLFSVWVPSFPQILHLEPLFFKKQTCLFHNQLNSFLTSN